MHQVLDHTIPICHVPNLEYLDCPLLRIYKVWKQNTCWVICSTTWQPKNFTMIGAGTVSIHFRGSEKHVHLMVMVVNNDKNFENAYSLSWAFSKQIYIFIFMKMQPRKCLYMWNFLFTHFPIVTNVVDTSGRHILWFESLGSFPKYWNDANR